MEILEIIVTLRRREPLERREILYGVWRHWKK
jgi:hypothetical protein